MSKFKPGDRIRAKQRQEIVGTVTKIVDGVAYLVLDSPIDAKDREGRSHKFREGLLDSKLEELFEIIEKTDWESLWDDAAD